MQLKHFGAAMASFGSIALFHIAGVTPEARRSTDVAPTGLPRTASARADVDGAAAVLSRRTTTVDVVVFSAPQL